MRVQLFEVDQGHLRTFLNLSDNLLCEVVEMLFGVHELLKVDHGVEVAHHEELVRRARHIHRHLVQ